MFSLWLKTDSIAVHIENINCTNIRLKPVLLYPMLFMIFYYGWEPILIQRIISKIIIGWALFSKEIYKLQNTQKYFLSTFIIWKIFLNGGI